VFDLGGDFESFVNVARYRTWSKAGMMTATAPRAWAVASTTAGEGRMTARARANPGEGSRAPAGGRVARWGARVGNARWVNGGVGGGFSVGGAVNGNKVVAAVAVNGKASRPSIDEMDMDPEHVKFASQDELDNRCARVHIRLAFIS